MRSSTMLREITHNETQEYLNNGVVMLPRVFSMAWIEYLRDATEVAMANPGPHGEEYAKGNGRFFGRPGRCQAPSAIQKFYPPITSCPDHRHYHGLQ